MPLKTIEVILEKGEKYEYYNCKNEALKSIKNEENDYIIHCVRNGFFKYLQELDNLIKSDNSNKLFKILYNKYNINLNENEIGKFKRIIERVTKPTTVSDAFYFKNDGRKILDEFGISFSQIYSNNKYQEYIKKLQDHFIENGRSSSYIDGYIYPFNLLLLYLNSKFPNLDIINNINNNIEQKSVLTGKNSITTDQIKNAYNIAKKVFDEEISRFDGIKILHDNFKFNEKSASGYIYVFNKLIKGEEYKHILSTEGIEYYLSNIKNDYGENIYKKALIAYEKHTKYIVELRKRNKLSKIDESNKILPIIIKTKNTIYDENQNHKLVSSDSYFIAGKIEEIFNQINNHYDNYQKKRIFETVPEMQELWFNIRTPCRTDGDFIKFINSLYMLFFETTKNKEPYGNLDNNGYPKYIKRLPEKFTKTNTSTYRFMDTVGILRHKIAHLKSKLTLPPWKITYPDALQELLNSKLEPRTTEQFQKLQIEVLNRFKMAMDSLLQIVEKELSSKNP